MAVLEKHDYLYLWRTIFNMVMIIIFVLDETLCSCQGAVGGRSPRSRMLDYGGRTAPRFGRPFGRPSLQVSFQAAGGRPR